MATEPAHVQYDEQYDEPDEEQPRSPKETLPTMYDLPDEEVGQPGMPDIFHVWQARLLDETFRPPNYEPDEIFTASDLNLYYNVHDFSQCKRPDWFAVVGLPKSEEMRLSYLIWQEGKSPLIVVELLSPSTMKEDLGRKLREVGKPPTKWEVYEQWLRVPYYVTFNRRNDEMRVFILKETRYEEVKDHQGRLWIEDVELGLGLWRGDYLRKERLWLRWYDRDGSWVPTPAEMEKEQAERERERAEQERERAEQERERAERERIEKEAALRKAEQLEARLREMGIDPERM